MSRARAIWIFIVAPTLILAASVLGALSAAGTVSRIVSAILSVAAVALIAWGVNYVRRLPKTP